MADRAGTDRSGVCGCVGERIVVLHTNTLRIAYRDTVFSGNRKNDGACPAAFGQMHTAIKARLRTR